MIKNKKLNGLQFEEILRILKNRSVTLSDISDEIGVSINCIYKWKKTGISALVTNVFKGLFSEEEWSEIMKLNNVISVDVEGVEFKLNNMDLEIFNKCNLTLLSDGRSVCYYELGGTVYNIPLANIILDTNARQTVKYIDGDVTNNTRDNIEILEDLMFK